MTTEELENLARDYIKARNAFMSNPAHLSSKPTTDPAIQSESDNFTFTRDALIKAAVSYHGPKTQKSNSIRLWAIMYREADRNTTIMSSRPTREQVSECTDRMHNSLVAEEMMADLLKRQ
jgi:hypothetical protein